MPVAGKNAACGKTALGEWVTLVRATVITGAYTLWCIEQGDLLSLDANQQGPGCL